MAVVIVGIGAIGAMVASRATGPRVVMAIDGVVRGVSGRQAGGAEPEEQQDWTGN